jgi:hypothetical protein
VPRVRATESCGSRPVAAIGARSRRSADELQGLRERIFHVCRENKPLTVRGLYYQLVTLGCVEKTEQAYKGVVRIAGEMRLDEELDWDWLEDGTRWMRKRPRYSSLGDMLERTAELYRRELWDESSDYVEVWLEKDALAGVLFDVTDAWGVPLMVARGYASLSFLHGAAEAIDEARRPAHLYLLTDHDPSGVDIGRQIERRVREFAPRAEVTFERLAVTEEQIARWKLPTRPTKLTDSRAAAFGAESVELDAIPPKELRELVRTAIERHVDPERLARLRVVEEAERETLKGFAALARKDVA